MTNKNFSAPSLAPVILVFALIAKSAIVFAQNNYRPINPFLQNNQHAPQPFQIPQLSQTNAFQNIDRANQQMIEQDMRNYELKRQRDQTLNDAYRDLEFNSYKTVQYEFPSYKGSGKGNYLNAFNELKKMLEGGSPLDLKRAVYLIEHAYDTSMRYSDYNQQIQDAVSVIGLKMKKDKVSQMDNTAKIMTAFQYMADTIKVYSTVGEKYITTYPKTYDFEDFWGRNDYKKMFVSKLMLKGSGQCHSMPLLFLILCQEINAEAYLSFSPNHSFVKFKDKGGRWHNIELTNGMLASDHKMIESGYVKAEAIQSKIFLSPVSKKETIAQCLNDLALGYSKQYGNDSFVKACTDLAIRNYPISLTAYQIRANYYKALGEFVIGQYRARGWTRQQLYADPKAMEIKKSIDSANKKIDQLGYSEMPADAYKAWLKSVHDEAGKQQHKNEVNLLNGMIQKR